MSLRLNRLVKRITKWLGCEPPSKTLSKETDSPSTSVTDARGNWNTGKPVILIIHGAWQHPAYYQAFVRVLQSRGYETHCPRLPSCGGQMPPTKFLEDDVDSIRKFTTELVDAGKLVHVIMHSYGGIVGTDALCGFDFDQRARHGMVGGIKSLVYLTSFMPQRGQSLVGLFEGQSMPTIKIDEKENLISPTRPIPMYYNDLPEEEAQYWVKQMVVHPLSAHSTPVKNEAFREYPVTYIICENDKGILPEVQQMMIDKIKAVGVRVQVERCTGSHSPFLSMPHGTSDIIERIVNA